MADSSEKRAYRARLGHSLSRGLAIVVLTMLAIGGVSLFFTDQVFDGYAELKHDDIHFMIVDDIEALFGRLALGILRPGRSPESFAAGIRHLEQELELALGRFDRTHTGTGDAEERATVEALWRAHAALGRVIREQPAGVDPHIAGEEVARITVMAHEAAERLRRSHRAVHIRRAEVAQTKLNILRVLYAISVFLGCGLIAAVALVARRRIVAPIQQLSATAVAIADGQLSARVRPLSVDDEVGRLVHAFNDMAGRLQEREQEVRLAQAAHERQLEQIRVLHRIGIDVARVRQLGPTLDVICEKARELLRVDAAALCLSAEGTACCTRRGMSGPADAFPAAVPVCCRMTADGRVTDECAGMHASYRVARLAVALGKPEEPTGYLCVGMRAARRFTPDEVDLLSALAAQAEIAVEKAALYEEIQGLAAAQERAWIAREMHDGLAQTLGALYLKLQQAQRRVPDGSAPAAESDLQEAIALIDQAYDEVRQCMVGLRTTPKIGFLPALREYVKDFGDRTGIAVAMQVEGEPLHLSPGSEVQLIRIVQEALANIRKHAKTEKAWLRIARDGTALVVTVEDEGCGFRAEPARPGLRQFGLDVMRERAESVGGSLTVESRPGQGTRVTATIPEGS
jgi:two-component system nitrate/nitrite sensor histidine kinase NarX